MRAAVCIAVVVALATTGCKQIFGLDSPTQADANGGPIATIGFAGPTTLSDEASGTINIPVLLTEPTDHEVSVEFDVLGGTATEGEDYTIGTGQLVVPVGEVASTLDITIAPDAVLEEDETIELALVSPKGATLGLSQHTVTISATVLPRVNFATATSTTAELGTLQQITATLDTPSTIPINVTIATSGTATSGTDYGVIATPLTFAPGSVSQVVNVNVLSDSLDEEDETIIVSMTSADAAIIGASGTHTITITDNDSPPTVSVSPPSQSVNEDVGTATFNVQLNTASGKDVTVPFTVGGTATVTSDYTYSTTSPITIPAGSTTATVTITIVNDTTDEPDETITTTLGTPTNAQLGASIQTLTITDDDVYCVGPAGTPFAVCYASAPTAASSLPTTLNTDSGAQCQAAQPLGWTTGGQPQACVIWATNISGSSTVVTGTRPLVLATSGTITITVGLDVSSRRNPSRVGPGAPSTLCAAFPTSPNGSPGGAGGGAGGSFMTKGGNGGAGNVIGGTAPTADAAEPTVLRAGCSGQRGGMGDTNVGGPAGAGGGAVYLVAGTSIVLDGADINASGAGGDTVNAGAADDAGGSGGGAGGMIRIYAPALSVIGTTIMANGGGGSEGSSELDQGNPGSDPSVSAPSVPAPGGANAAPEGGNGGTGFAGSFQAVSGFNGMGGAGGGGGGGGGLIRSNLALTGATVSAGSIVIQ